MIDNLARKLWNGDLFIRNIQLCGNVQIIIDETETKLAGKFEDMTRRPIQYIVKDFDTFNNILSRMNYALSPSTVLIKNWESFSPKECRVLLDLASEYF